MMFYIVMLDRHMTVKGLNVLAEIASFTKLDDLINTYL